jgi:transposase
MMGQRPSQQNELFYDFCLEKHIPQDHFLRQIDQFLDFESIRSHLKPYYSHTGRPSVDPELMIRMLLIGYCYGIRSERRLCEEVNFNLAYRWFCKRGLEDAVPDHSSFSKNRHGRFRESDLFRFVFDAVVQQCQEQQLIQGEGFATDASYVRADASWERYATSISDLLAQRRDSRAVKEYLDALDSDAGLVSEQKRISQTDPPSRWMLKYGPARFYYCTNYLIDVEHKVIVDVEATPTNRSLEVKSTQKMIDRVEDKLGITPKRLLADTAYGTGPMLDWLVNQKGIKPHIPVFDKTRRKDGAFEVGDFQWDDKKPAAICLNRPPVSSATQ